MKTKTLLTALFIFLLINGNAFQKNSSLDIDVIEHPSKTYVIEMENGTTYETSSDIRIDNLRVGRNGLKIFKRTYIGSKRGRQRFDKRLVYSGAINIPRNSIVFSQLRNRELFVNSVVPKHIPHTPNHKFGMHQRRFQDLKHAIQHESFDKDKLAIMTQASRNGVITSIQVLQLINLLSFDSYKLKFAKNAYKNTVDKQKYFKVRKGLVFTSSRRKLTQFINNQSHHRPKNRRTTSSKRR